MNSSSPEQHGMSKLGEFRNYLSRFLYVLGRPTRKKIPLLIVGFGILSSLDLLGLSLLGPFVGIVASPEESGPLNNFPHLSKALASFDTITLTAILGGIIVLIFMIKAVSGFLVQRAIARIALQHQQRIKIQLLSAHLSLPLEEALQTNSSSLITLVHQHSAIFTNRIMLPGMKMLSETVFFVFLLIFLFVLNPLVTSSLIVLFISIIFIYDRLVKKKINQASLLTVESVRNATKIISQSSAALKEIRISRTEDYFLSLFSDELENYANANIYVKSLATLPRYIIETTVIAFVIVLLLAGLAIYGGPDPELLSTVGIFAFAGIRSIGSINSLMMAANNLRFGQKPLDELYDDIRHAERTDKYTFNRSAQQKYKPSDTINGDFPDEVTIRNVSYTYPNAKQPSLKDINLSFRKGQSIGLVGSSGSGKSTMVDLILGLLRPQHGDVLRDGESIYGDLDSWFSQIAYIPQSVFLLDDTIAANIAFGIPKNEIDMSRLQRAIQSAQLQDFVSKAPHGFDTIVGERGTRISGGQRQRIAIARAIYQEKSFIVMDEASAALDVKTESEIVDALAQLPGNLTTVIVAHRFSTLRYCDTIYRIEEGVLTKQGSFEELTGESESPLPGLNDPS